MQKDSAVVLCNFKFLFAFGISLDTHGQGPWHSALRFFRSQIDDKTYFNVSYQNIMMVIHIRLYRRINHLSIELLYENSGMSSAFPCYAAAIQLNIALRYTLSLGRY